MPTADSMSYFWRKNKLRVEFQNVTPEWENRTTTYAFTLANWYISAHSTDPGEAGSQTTNEANLAVLGRVAVPRTAGGWDVTDTDTQNPFASNVSGITFGKNTSGIELTVSHIGIGTDATGAGYLARVIALDTPIDIPDGATFAISAGQLKIWER
jgi:hypothetical protein